MRIASTSADLRFLLVPPLWTLCPSPGFSEISPRDTELARGLAGEGEGFLGVTLRCPELPHSFLGCILCLATRLQWLSIIFSSFWEVGKMEEAGAWETSCSKDQDRTGWCARGPGRNPVLLPPHWLAPSCPAASAGSETTRLQLQFQDLKLSSWGQVCWDSDPYTTFSLLLPISPRPSWEAALALSRTVRDWEWSGCRPEHVHPGSSRSAPAAEGSALRARAGAAAHPAPPDHLQCWKLLLHPPAHE